MIKKYKIIITTTIIVALFFSGCSYKIGFNNNYISNDLVNMQKKNSKHTIKIYNSSLEMQTIDEIHSSTFKGGPISLKLPLTGIAHDVTFKYYEQYFQKVINAKTLSDIVKNEIQVYPLVKNFKFGFLDNLISVTPFVDYDFMITLKDNKGIEFYSKKLNSGMIYGETYSMKSVDNIIKDINKAYHKSLLALLKIIEPEVLYAIKNHYKH